MHNLPDPKDCGDMRLTIAGVAVICAAYFVAAFVAIANCYEVL